MSDLLPSAYAFVILSTITECSCSVAQQACGHSQWRGRAVPVHS
jgi:hypothetical protein